MACGPQAARSVTIERRHGKSLLKMRRGKPSGDKYWDLHPIELCGQKEWDEVQLWRHHRDQRGRQHKNHHHCNPPGHCPFDSSPKGHRCALGMSARIDVEPKYECAAAEAGEEVPVLAEPSA